MRSRVVIALLSPVSVDRRWINFEAGIGMGQGSRVIPVVIRGLAKSEIGQPLGQLQAREISKEADLKALLEDVAAACLVSVELKGAAAFVADLGSIYRGRASFHWAARLTLQTELGHWDHHSKCQQSTARLD